MDSTAELRRQIGNLIRFGTIAEVDPARARCRVKSGELLTDVVAWMVPLVGDTVAWSAPSVGEQVVLLSPGGDTHAAVALRGLYCQAFPAPDSDPARHLLRFPDGAEFDYDHDAHHLKATLPSGGRVTITADGGVTINGPLTVNGDAQINGDAGVSGTATAEVDVVGAGISLKSHKHVGVSAGSGVSGPPQ